MSISFNTRRPKDAEGGLRRVILGNFGHFALSKSAMIYEALNSYAFNASPSDKFDGGGRVYTKRREVE